VHAPWYPALRSELLGFPAGRHDDQVDMLGLIGQLLDKMTAGRKPVKDTERKRDAYVAYTERVEIDLMSL